MCWKSAYGTSGQTHRRGRAAQQPQEDDPLTETEPQSRGHATASAHCTMDHGTKALCSPSGVSHPPIAICNCGQ